MQISAPRSSKAGLAVATMALVASAASATALPNSLAKRDDCGNYTIISTRGTGEVQGPSIAFAVMIRDTLAQVPGGAVYDTVYAADILQQSEPATLDILNKIKTTLDQCPGHKFALLGYSQGATATTEALTRIQSDDAAYNAVVACVTVGNPRHNKGLQSNYDVDGGKTTEMSFGLLSYLPPIPTRWDTSGKVRDVCAPRDGVCDAASGTGIGPNHFLYTASNWTQSEGTKLMTNAFQPAASTPTESGKPQSDAAPALSASTPALFAAVAAVGFGALLTVL